MKKYISPELQLVTVNPCDVICTSLGTETTPMPENGGFWEWGL